MTGRWAGRGAECLAHREKQEQTEVQALFAGGTVGELWRLTTFLLQLHTVLWELLNNGRKPVFRSVRRSVRSIYNAVHHRPATHESIVADVKKLMRFIEKAAPNKPLKRTRKKPRAA